MGITKERRDAIEAVKAWCAKRGIRLLSRPCHVHPRAYVLEKRRRGLEIARPWMDCEPQIRKFELAYPTRIVYRFDESLKKGDWCITAYICTPTSGEPVAIPVPEPK